MNEQIEKYFLGELTSNERLELLKKVEADKSWQAEFTKCQHTFALLSASDEVIDKQDSRDGYQAFTKRIRRRNVRNIAIRITGYAAAVALIALSVHFFHVLNRPVIDDTVASKMVSLFVPNGQRMSITLQDGTVVWLNAQTRLTYPTEFTEQERRIEIEGEAYLTVAKDTEKPFIVSSNGIEMKVLGTTFNIYSYPDETIRRISLLEGCLQVYDPQSGTEGVVLKPNEQVVIEGKKMLVEPIPYTDYFLWKDGIYSFYNEPLGNILKRLELYYDIEIEVRDTSILDWEYTGKFRQRDGIDEIIRLMQRIRAFHAEKDKNNHKIILSK